MAQLSMGEAKWRMVRRVLKKKRFRYEDARNMARQDEQHFEWLVGQGLVAAAGGGWFELTAKGKESAELGLYEL